MKRESIAFPFVFAEVQDVFFNSKLFAVKKISSNFAAPFLGTNLYVQKKQHKQWIH